MGQAKGLLLPAWRSGLVQKCHIGRFVCLAVSVDKLDCSWWQRGIIWKSLSLVPARATLGEQPRIGDEGGWENLGGCWPRPCWCGLRSSMGRVHLCECNATATSVGLLDLQGTHLAMCGGWEATLVTSESGVYLQCLLLFTLCGRNANNDTHLYLWSQSGF